MRTCLLLFAIITLGITTSAHAQPADEPKAPGTAIAGMALLGGEVAASVSTAFGVRKVPVLFAVTSVGFSAGLIGGIFANRIPNPIRHDVVGISTLIAGMGGVIPSVLIVLQVRSNDANKKDKKNKKEETALLVPPGLLNVSEDSFHLSVPSLLSFTPKEKEIPVGAVLFSGSF